MGRKKSQTLQDKDIVGLKYFKAISKTLEVLHDAGCERDRAGNRILHMDEYISLFLLYMFNPICVSLRSLQKTSQLKKVQRKLKVPRASLGSLSEAASVFDSNLMLGVIKKLIRELKPTCHNAKLDNIERVLTAVDGTVVKALPTVTWALYKQDYNAFKAHVQFELIKGVPIAATITEGKANERTVLQQNLEDGRIYVTDRGYAKYGLLQRIIDAGSSFVCRLCDNAVYETLEERSLSDEAVCSGVLSDRIVRLGGDGKDQDISQPIRLVEIKSTPHKKRYKTGRGGPEQGETILIATDLLDLGADVIAEIFKHRWAVEIFFRFFKHVLGCRHLLSHSRNGIELQTYAAIIACLLISLWTSRKPTLRTYEMVCWYFVGMAEEDELIAHINSLEKAS